MFPDSRRKELSALAILTALRVVLTWVIINVKLLKSINQVFCLTFYRNVAPPVQINMRMVSGDTGLSQLTRFARRLNVSVC